MLESPTTRTYASLDRAYDHFNRKLFGNQLPPCLITTQRHKGAYGYFSGDRFACIDKPEDITDEIALNPAGFRRPYFDANHVHAGARDGPLVAASFRQDVPCRIPQPGVGREDA